MELAEPEMASIPQGKRTGHRRCKSQLEAVPHLTRITLAAAQTLLRHSDVKFTLQYYTHSVSDDRMAAGGAMLAAILIHAADGSGPRAD